ncbi:MULTISPECIES: hypothetical protein [Moorena]|uniref:hypothetical protein n=1 Tax=Moorena TaxID=1155738 RepID=UPI0002D623FC|nr:MULTISPECIES: hypothetical protein [Moorena]NEP32217.1 hypothetical protein [Moorena sp. SIO3B2]NEQ06993.1 hypothetical protein [Moorena sp. SIO4E2]NER88537.1 hypothetical protein [Moorena sp. SIO3A2]NET67739.1 hypothetical protein [Moorena sp. SIO1G6]
MGNCALLVVFHSSNSLFLNSQFPITRYPLPITQSATIYLSHPLLKTGLEHIITRDYQR